LSQICLIVESTFQGVSLGLVSLEQSEPLLLWRQHHANNQGTSQALSRLLEQGLGKLACEMSAVGLIAVSTGPGSFTGIKIGLAWVYGLKAAHPRIQLQGFSGLACAGRQLFEAVYREPLQLILPSTKTHGFRATVSGSDQKNLILDLVHISERDEDQGDLAKWLDEGPKRVVLAGHWSKLQDELAKRGQVFEAKSLEELGGYGLDGMLWQFKEKGSSQFSDRLPRPVYLRHSTAEEKRMAEGKFENIADR
jgi:tRNA A37 threonylcarbamoyladenosine modification protein TsaB